MFEFPLRGLLQFVAESYDRHHPDGYDQPAQTELSRVAETLGEYAPLGFRIDASGQKPFPLTVTPWIGFLNLDESSSFQNGIYIVYLFDAQMKKVFLSLNQGTEDLRKKLKMGEKERIETLRRNAAAIRSSFTDSERVGTVNEIDLLSDIQRPRSYVAGNILAIEYSLDSLPSEEVLSSDLGRFFELYSRSLQIRNKLVLDDEGTFVGMHNNPALAEQVGLGGFNPKSDSVYEVDIKARKMVKSRRHETLVNHFGTHAKAIGFFRSTPHPIDVLLSYQSEEWIVEAKIIYDLNYAEGVRGAIGQLMEYRHFIKPDAQQVALFDQPIGDAYIGLLQSLGISVIYLTAGKWIVHSTDEPLLKLRN
jgi:hypothetical protein